jgi:hypothetical protein
MPAAPRLAGTALFLLALAAPGAAAQEYDEFKGTIRAPNGNPLPFVTAKVAGHQSSSSNHHGDFYVSSRRPGESLRLEISPGYLTGSDEQWGCPSADPPLAVEVPAGRDEQTFVVNTVQQIDRPELEPEEARFIDMVNAARAERGRQALTPVPRLHALAAVQATTLDIFPDRISTYPHRGYLCDGSDTRAAEIGVLVDPNGSGVGRWRSRTRGAVPRRVRSSPGGAAPATGTR